MRNILTVMKKDLVRFFTDKRMIMSLLLPGIIIFIMYSLMGDFISDIGSESEDYEYKVIVCNPPENAEYLKDSGLKKVKFNEAASSEIDDAKKSVENKDCDLLIVFEDDFNQKISNGNIPEAELYYNSTSVESSSAYAAFQSALFMSSVTQTFRFTVNSSDKDFDLATEEDESMLFITMMLPYILIIFLFTGCMSISTEAIAGEKERHTIATLLVTPVKRSEIAIGKILALSITSLVSATASFLGLIASIPKLMGGEGASSVFIYGASTYILTFLIILMTILVFTVLLSIVSTIAKSVKEASGLALPVMVIVMLVAISSITNMGVATSNRYLYLIPIYNSVQCLTGILSMNVDPISFVFTIVSNAALFALGVYALTSLFKSEKVMFNC